MTLQQAIDNMPKRFDVCDYIAKLEDKGWQIVFNTPNELVALWVNNEAFAIKLSMRYGHRGPLSLQVERVRSIDCTMEPPTPQQADLILKGFSYVARMDQANESPVDQGRDVCDTLRSAGGRSEPVAVSVRQGSGQGQEPAPLLVVGQGTSVRTCDGDGVSEM